MSSLSDDFQGVLAPLGDLVVANYGKALPRARRQGGDVPVYGSNGVVGHHDVAITSGPAIIIGRKGSSGAVNFSPSMCWPIDTTYYIDNPGPFTFEYLTLLLRSLGLEKLDRSTAIPGLNRDALYEIKVAVPSKSTQEEAVRLATAAEDHGSRSHHHLTNAGRLLEKFRRSVLLSAASGVLTRSWRISQGLPEWTARSAQDACAKVQSGTTPKEWHTGSDGVPFLKVYNIVDQKLDFNYRPQFVSPDLLKGKLKRTETKPGDVIMNIVGPPLGKVAIIPDDFPTWSINQALTLFRPSQEVTTDWLYIFLSSGMSVANILGETKGSVGQVNISLTQCRGFSIPVPTRDEQDEIARRVKEMFALGDQVALHADRASHLVDQSVHDLVRRALRAA